MAVFRAALTYALSVFAVGFALGVLRTVLLAPRFGETIAVAIELPLMLAAAWLICGMVLRRIAVPPNLAARAAMGGFAFAILIACEAIVGLALMRLSVEEWLMRFSTPQGALGLAAQIAFAAFPALRRG
jgi:hypothetical protein